MSDIYFFFSFHSSENVFYKEDFLAYASFRKGFIQSHDLDLGLTHSIIHVCASYHSLSAYGSGEDVL